MGALSKHVLPDFSCYEVGHTWTTSCTQAWKDIALAGYKTAFKIYLPLYIVALIIRQWNKEKQLVPSLRQLVHTLPDVLRSTFFLGTNGLAFIVTFCLWRRWIPYYHFYQVFTCGAPCSVMALTIEKKERRSLLAAYMATIAVETLYLMMKARGILRPLPYGETLLFSLATGVLLQQHSSGRLQGSWQSIVRFLFGARPSASGGCGHDGCCWRHALTHFCRLLALGYGGQCCLRLLTQLPLLLRRPAGVLRDALTRPDAVRFGCFLGSLSGLYHAVTCCLRRVGGGGEGGDGGGGGGSWRAAVAGFVAGWSMLAYRSSGLALQAAAKAAGLLLALLPPPPRLPGGELLLYAAATSVVFHCAVFEPHSLRREYWQFLLRLTDGRFAHINRRILDIFGTGASRLYPDFWPLYLPAASSLHLGPDELARRLALMRQ